MEKKKENKFEKATFAMGCFWKPQLLFSKINGVVKTEVGYAGGDNRDYKKPSYEEVCSGKTGHAEVVRITFNPEKIAYDELLEIFWKNHDATQTNRQGPDIGTQYRSAIFYESDKQKEKALVSREKMQKKSEKKITTEIKKMGGFYRAEEYHQNYLAKRGMESCGI